MFHVKRAFNLYIINLKGAPMNTRSDTPSPLAFWLRWTLLTLLGFALATYAATLFRQLIAYGGIHRAQFPSNMAVALAPDGIRPALILATIFTSELIQMSLLAAAQWYVLKQVIDVSPHWIWLTAGGAALAAAPFEYGLGTAILGKSAWLQAETLGLDHAQLLLVVYFASSALLVSALQWWLLRRSMPRAAWWIPASVLIGTGAYLLATQTGLPYHEWNLAVLMGPLREWAGVPAASILGSMLAGLLLQSLKQAMLAAVLLLLLRGQPTWGSQPAPAPA